jgi:hypothetical protein
VLILVNDINAHGARRLGLPTLDPPYRDVTGDGWLTAADVITVINRINTAGSTAAALLDDDLDGLNDSLDSILDDIALDVGQALSIQT